MQLALNAGWGSNEVVKKPVPTVAKNGSIPLGKRRNEASTMLVRKVIRTWVPSKVKLGREILVHTMSIGGITAADAVGTTTR